jgi:hypothetical protein
LNTTHSLYATNSAGQAIDKFYFEEDNWKKGKLLRLTNLNLNASFRFTPWKKEKKEKTVEFAGTKEWSSEVETMPSDTALPPENVLYVPPIQNTDRLLHNLDFKPPTIAWDWSATLRYSWNQPNPTIEASKTLWLENNLNIKLTKNWSVSYNNRVDLVNGQVVSSGFSFYRDLHCWEGRFIWNPTGVGQGFYLKINVKSSSLQDLKIERRKGVGGFLY